MARKPTTQKSHLPHGKRGNPNPRAPMKGTRFGGGPDQWKRQKIKEDALRAEAEGIMPKFALLRVMRRYIEEYETIEAARPRRPLPKNIRANPDALAEYQTKLALWREDLVNFLELIRVAAADAAPYFSAKLSSIKMQSWSPEDIPKLPIESFTDDQLAIILQRIERVAGPGGHLPRPEITPDDEDGEGPE